MSRTRGWLAAVLALAASTPYAAARTPYQQGVAAFESGDLAGARSWLAAVDLRAEPHAGFLLGVVAERSRAWAEAVTRFDRYLASVPARAELAPLARAHRAFCLASAGRADAALPDLAAAPATADRTTAFLLGYADLIAARKAGGPQDRLAAATRAEARFARLVAAPHPDDAEAENALGLARLALAGMEKDAATRNARLAAARSAFTRAAALSREDDPTHQSAMRGLGRVQDLTR